MFKQQQKINDPGKELVIDFDESHVEGLLGTLLLVSVENMLLNLHQWTI